ncbi:hypothetical protein Tco_1205715, partial [Tanacetum coccineum]
SIEDEEVSLVDGVLESALGALGGMMLIFGLLEALKIEALVDAMDVDSGLMNDDEEDGVLEEMEYLHEKFGHHHHHHHHHQRIDEMTCLDDEKMKKRRNDVPCHDHFEVVEFVLGQEDA